MKKPKPLLFFAFLLGGIPFATLVQGADWNRVVAESSSSTGLGLSLKMAPDGNPHIAYYAFDQGTSEFDFYYTRLEDGNWIHTLVESESAGATHSGIDIAPDGTVGFAYFDGMHEARYARFDGSNFVRENVGILAIDFDPEIAFDAAGLPHYFKTSVSFQNQSGDPMLDYGTRAGGSWSFDSVATSSEGFGESSFVLDAQDEPHFLFHPCPEEDLRYVYLDSMGNEQEEVVSDGGPAGHMGETNDLAVDQEGIPHAAFADNIANRILHAQRTAPNTWVIEEVLAPAASLPLALGIQVGEGGRVHILYRLGTVLSLAIREPGASTWSHEEVHPAFAADLYTALDLDACGNPVVAYRSNGNAGNLRYAESCRYDLADDDQDGVPCLIEALTGSSDQVAGDCRFGISASGEYQYVRRRGGTGDGLGNTTWGRFTYTVEESDALGSWVAVANETVTSIDSDWEQVNVGTTPGIRKFVRLKVGRQALP